MSAPRFRALVASLFFVALAVLGSFAFADPPHYAAAISRIEIDATPITSFDNRDASLTRFGDLEFRGGLVLASNNPAFGGLSGIYVEADGSHFIALTDRGSWLRGRIVYRDGRPAGIADAEIAPILGPDGKPLAARGWYDAESLAERDGMLYVGIERVEQIVRFDYRRDGLLARGQPIKVPPDLSTFLLCPMPGQIVRIDVKEGEVVESGQPLAIVEAMKMENVLKAERRARVSKVRVKPGAVLAVDEVILEFEAV